MAWNQRFKSLCSVSEHLVAGKFFSTSSCVSKKTPHTIGTMSWVKASRRRKYLEKGMKEKPRGDHQIIKENILARTEPQIEFLTTSRTKTRMNEDVMHQYLVEPTVFLSKDQQTIICYHPPSKPVPEHFTKRATSSKVLGIPDREFDNFKETMTKEQIEEAKQLREKDPSLWTANTLAIMMQVKPNVISESVPLSRDLALAVRAEKKLFDGMSVNNRKKFKDLQTWERMKYVEETRGLQYASWFKTFNNKAHVSVPVPPKR